jgi:hypothetical protein
VRLGSTQPHSSGNPKSMIQKRCQYTRQPECVDNVFGAPLACSHLRPVATIPGRPRASELLRPFPEPSALPPLAAASRSFSRASGVPEVFAASPETQLAQEAGCPEACRNLGGSPPACSDPAVTVCCHGPPVPLRACWCCLLARRNHLRSCQTQPGASAARLAMVADIPTPGWASCICCRLNGCGLRTTTATVRLMLPCAPAAAAAPSA